jgi:uncharacterized protein (TIGR02186 family)
MHRLGLSALCLLALVVSGLVFAQRTLANGLAADVSDRLIAITTAFVGGDVVVFGAIDETQGDIVITMQGPRQNQTVRRKSRIAGIWVNRDRISFEDTPSFFAIAATRSLDDIASSSVRGQFGLGVDYLSMTPIDATGYSPEETEAFAKALIRNKQKAGLYTKAPLSVTFPGPKLFRATFSFPANVPPGNYQIEVFRFVEGRVTGAQRSSLQISKVGLEAEVFDFANQRSALYGMVAIIIAVAAGWLAGVVFRRA